MNLPPPDPAPPAATPDSTPPATRPPADRPTDPAGSGPARSAPTQSSGTTRQRADAQGGSAQSADRQRSDPQGTDQRGTNAQNGPEQGADRQRADAQSATPQGSDPRSATPQGTDPQTATAQGSDPRSATPQGSDPQSATAQGSDPRSATVQGSDPRSATAQGSDPQTATAQGTDRQRADAQSDTAQFVTPQRAASAISSVALAGGVGGSDALAAFVAEALNALREGAVARGGPLPAGGPRGVADALRALLTPGALLPEVGEPEALLELTRALAAGAADPADPACAAHLHVPPLAVAAAADLAVAALNPSLDSWDQAPSGTEIETAVLRLLAGLVGFAEPDDATGVFTTGGTESNLMALLLARDAVLAKEFGTLTGGALPPEAAGRLRIHCSRAAHFSLARAASVLGLGAQAVVPIDTTDDGALDPRLLDWTLADARTAGHVLCCVVATAGTTDLGAIDPLRSVAAVTARHGVRLHVDAAYGGGALFSRTLAPLLDGLGLADTVGLDLHKLGWQPVAAGVLLAREAAMLTPLEQRVAYLNPADDEEAGYTSLLGRSLRTTRRPDAFKVAVTLRTLGRSGLGALVDRCHALAQHAARAVAAEPRLELVAEPILTTVLFRYLPHDQAAAEEVDAVNAELRRRLLAEGAAVVGRTELPGPAGGVGPGGVRLKLTLLNPHTTEADLDRLLALVVAAGAAVERERSGSPPDGRASEGSPSVGQSGDRSKDDRTKDGRTNGDRPKARRGDRPSDDQPSKIQEKPA
ncbi:L-2,4-diaminobutyrate decarboxylase [Streptacidiphilus sp. MAP12-20]|uniref:pyridoxal-dependent decarboxylase n=1 Tax=Streptacidiphilus sp. MAP12-20 TaxID=3156299 RepID=UPI0035136056